MDYNSGICYTWSGDKKMYEPDLFKAKLNVAVNEWCFRCDSYDNKTLVFGKPGEISDHLYAYLPYGDLSINHNIQANGEDHYRVSGKYTNPPRKWFPPAGVDGPFDSPYILKYPYYEHWHDFSYNTTVRYGPWDNSLIIYAPVGNVHYYGHKE